MKLRVVFDTNVYLSALLFGGIPRHILGLALEQRLVLVASGAILQETATKLARKFSWPEHRVEQFMRQTRALAEICEPKHKLRLHSPVPVRAGGGPVAGRDSAMDVEMDTGGGVQRGR